MIIYISGGVKSGKSRYAQQLAKELTENPAYVATAKVWDDDFHERIKRHQADRGAEWENFEETHNVSALPIAGKTVVVDCLTLWLTNFFIDAKQEMDECLKLVKAEIDKLHKMEGTYIIVSNEIGMGVHAETSIGRKFTDLQGLANQYVAAKAERVYFMVSGIPLTIK
ncbi:bifunctional adenosylcobinamide kinase/adenosylcobinamide-phosphate guanylyltransferase [Solitalea sp. MAHUQ-68]|uniref:Adenosylcobinamide kinase n=1 Tax=Solitalea agri TaxID=2953739 RepID=A0A9X2F445_9SPHI|nr:bifunctional adenosylcobinamide kinase/adenosylcobinamide-phosphate guanylyltransferase [Solitalea agri]MCO4293825.1 bifunctional adenosylcobinamide kinase/adenosylcobinamide-phosphate guanylyltransferase [Solitalea agri]